MEAVVRGVKRLCAAGLDSVTLRRKVAALLLPALDFDGYAFSTCDPDTGLMASTVADGIQVGLARVYLERLYPEECARIAMDMPRRGRTVYSMLDESPEARDEFHRHGVDVQLHLSLPANGRLWGTWCLMRADSPARSVERERALLERLVPELARGVRAATLVDQGLAASRIESVDAGPGVLILDARARVVLRTPAAAMWFADLADVGVRSSEELPVAVLALATRLRIRRTDVPEELRLRMRGQSGRWYVLRASLSEPDASGESSTVVVVRPAAPREMATILTRLYGLSDREREVIAAVARGASTKEIAHSFGVSPYTVEEHIGRACRKIGVRGRKALVAKLFVDGYVGGSAPGDLSASPEGAHRSAAGA